VRATKRYLFLAAVLGGMIVVVPALASSESSPTVSGLESIMWSPAEASVEAGGAVTFQDTSAVVPHGVVWETGNPETPACDGVPLNEGETDWKGSCTFAKAGIYKYYCYVHGMEMSGTINVGSSGTTTTAPTTTTTPGGTTPTSPTVPPREPNPEQTPGSPLAGSAANAIRLARIQHGNSVSGSVEVSQAGVGARLEVDLLTSSASLGKARHSTRVRVGHLLRSAVKAGKLSFRVTLDAQGRAALHRNRRLALTVKITLTPENGKAVKLTRGIVVHRQA
jgi:plastocyanin